MVYLKKVLVALSLLIVVGCNSSPTAPTTIEVTPRSVSITTGGSAQLEVIGEQGGVITEGVDWSSSNPFMVPVDDSGRVTGGYGAGTVEITAVALGVSDVALVTLSTVCVDPVPLSGDPDPNAEIQRFDVRYQQGVDAAGSTQALAGAYGFRPDNVGADGFEAALTPTQAGGVGCSRDVASMTYL